MRTDRRLGGFADLLIAAVTKEKGGLIRSLDTDFSGMASTS